jgi:hypothetical protein
MKRSDPNYERGVMQAVLIKPSEMEYARIGGLVVFSAAAREGLAPYIKLGKIRAGVLKPDEKPRMEL